MALLSQAAIALLGRLDAEASTWTDLTALELDAMRDRALHELHREGLVEMQVWPPPDPDRRRYRARGRVIDDAVERRSQVRVTPRGSLRLRRIRGGR